MKQKLGFFVIGARISTLLVNNQSEAYKLIRNIQILLAKGKHAIDELKKQI